MAGFVRVVLIALACGPLADFAPAVAQAVPKQLQQGGSEEAIRTRKNAWTVGIVGGLMEGTYMRFADEMAKAFNDGDQLRILPIVSYGAASNLEDLLYLRGIDVAVTQSDVFEFFRTQRKTPNLDKRVHFVIRLPVSEMHVLARTEYKSIEDLRGKKVNFGPPGSASSLTGSIIFQRLGVEVESVNMDNPTALQKMRSGEVAALVRVVGKPVDFFTKLPQDSGVHFLPIPFSKIFSDYYTVSEFTPQDYPTLIAPGQRVDTVAVPAVLAVYNWPRGSDRYRRLERFVERMLTNWDTLQRPPFHRKWRDVNLAATVPGWTRFSVAERVLQQTAATASAEQDNITRDFETFLSGAGARSGGAARSQAEREALFKEFMSWRSRQNPKSR